MSTHRHLATTVGGSLLILLGVARGAGGLVLTIQGSRAVDSSGSARSIAQALGLGLIAIGLLAVFAAVHVLRGRPRALSFALTALCIFVVDGVLNGYLLFGQPRSSGTIANILTGLIIGSFLWFGDRAAVRTTRT